MFPHRLISLQSSGVSLLIKRNIRRQKPPPGKPPILPPSKKVLYNVSHPEWEKPAYVEELLWRRHVYNNAIESLRKVFAQELKQKELEGLAIESLRKQEIEELDALIVENERRNQKSAEKRQLEYTQELEGVRREIEDEIEQHLQEEQVFIEQKSEEVRKVIERSGKFITHANLDSRLSEVLEEPVVYDFAIDLKGSTFKDPTPVKYQTGVPTRQKGRLYDRTLTLSGGAAKESAA